MKNEKLKIGVGITAMIIFILAVIFLLYELVNDFLNGASN